MSSFPPPHYNSMAVRISFLSFFLGVVWISCMAPRSLSHSFTDGAPIRLASGGLRDVESTAFFSKDRAYDDDLSFAHLISPPIEDIYQFGDSISDVGNSMYIDLKTNNNCAKSPYGESYFHKPTGRCSDGLLMIDYFAQFFGLPFLDPYLNRSGNFTHGVNFAVGGSTALDISILAKKYNITSPIKQSLSVQLGWYKSHLESICSSASECKRKLSRALIFMGEIGANDYNYAFFEGKSLQAVYPMVPRVVQTIKNAVEEVIILGATRIIIPGDFSLGCASVYLMLFKTSDPAMYDESGCLKYYNKFANYHNSKLKQAIRELQMDYPNVSLVYLDYYKALKEIIGHPTSYGFDKKSVHEACLGGHGPPCENPYQYVSWDGVHFTQHAYHVMAKWLMRDIVYGISFT